MNDSSILVEIVEEVAEQVRLGKKPDLQEYLQRFPKLESELRRILPLVGLVEQLGNAVGGAIDPQSMEELGSPLPHRLGDYELLRQIGQGGMGAVYEAKQLSLNRLVALKILTPKFQDRRRFRERFDREARAAARLHHTNIVPIFGYGEEHGVTYYSMQLINGVSLDQVVAWLRTRAKSSDRENQLESTVIGVEVASRDMLDNDECDLQKAQDQINVIPAEILNGLTTPDRRYEIIARFGIETAHALHHAHSMGVVHRDIKPANILIDRNSQIWITDFGLAKAIQDEGLTEQNDVLGTIRYLSPERFRGIADARSDLYSLALTLYEILTLRPAFDASDRNQLLQQTLQGNHPKLRQLDPLVPGPLSIIIEKGLAADPADRYQSVADFADDLQRFIDDRSIAAKPDRWSTKCFRWCRHNPAVASLTAALIMLVLGLLVQQQLVMTQRDRYRQSLADSLISQSQFQRLSGRVGQKLESLGNIAQAANLRHSSESDHAQLASEALRAMVLPDLEQTARWPVEHESFAVDSVALSSDFRYYVALSEGTAEVRQVPESTNSRMELVQPLRLLNGRPVMVKFSPGGRWLLVILESASNQRLLQMFDLSRRSSDPLDAALVVELVAELAADVDASDSLLSVGVQSESGWQLRCYDLQTLKVHSSTTIAGKPFNVRYEPRGPRVAVTLPDAHCIDVVNSAGGSLDNEIPLNEDIYAVAWHPVENQLAVGLGFDVVVFDMDRPDQFMQMLKGHTWMVHQLYFDRHGDYLVSHSLREGNSRIWDLRRRRQVLEIEGHIRGFNLSGDEDQQLAFVDASHLSTYLLRSDEDFQTIAANDSKSANCWRTINHSRFPWLVSGGSDGLVVWHAASGRLLARAPGYNIYTLCNDESTGEIITAGPGGIHAWRIHLDPENDQCSIDSPRSLSVLGETGSDSLSAFGYIASPDGRMRVASINEGHPSKGKIIRHQQAGELIILSGFPFAALSPNGRWIAGSRFEQPGFNVWHIADDSQSRVVKTDGITAQLFFSPDSSMLLACTNDRFTMFDTSTWKPLWEKETSQVVEGSAAFTPDSRFVAMFFGLGEVRVIDTRTATEVLCLDCRQDQVNVLNLHFLPDGERLCLSCGPAGLRVWRLDHVRQWMERHSIAWPLSMHSR